MKKRYTILALGVLLSSMAFQSCTSNSSVNEQDAVVVPENSEKTDTNTTSNDADIEKVNKESAESSNRVEEQIALIKDKFSVISEDMKAGKYKDEKYETECGGGITKLNKAMDGSDLRFLSKNDCSDHGCTKTSYYFWEGALLFKFIESSYWVGTTDEVEQKRIYYKDGQVIRCLQKKTSGTKGYDAAIKALSNMKNAPGECEDKDEMAYLKNLVHLADQHQVEDFFCGTEH